MPPITSDNPGLLAKLHMITTGGLKSLMPITFPDFQE
jgi:hypothetical protein